MKKIIITGATGFIGVHLVEKWIDRGAEIYAVVRPSSKNIARLPKCRNVHVVELELGCYEHLLNIVGDADFFYHLAWEGARVPYRDDGLMQSHNYDCAIQAYDKARRLNVGDRYLNAKTAKLNLRSGNIDKNLDLMREFVPDPLVEENIKYSDPFWYLNECGCAYLINKNIISI